MTSDRRPLRTPASYRSRAARGAQRARRFEPRGREARIGAHDERAGPLLGKMRKHALEIIAICDGRDPGFAILAPAPA